MALKKADKELSRLADVLGSALQAADMATQCSSMASQYNGLPDSTCASAATTFDSARPQLEASVPAGCSVDVSGPGLTIEHLSPARGPPRML